MKTKLFCLIALSVLSLTTSSLAKDEFVAHEWGTFTSVQGADGIQLEWNPLIRTDLPEFVYNRMVKQGRRGTLGIQKQNDVFAQQGDPHEAHRGWMEPSAISHRAPPEVPLPIERSQPDGANANKLWFRGTDWGRSRGFSSQPRFRLRREYRSAPPDRLPVREWPPC